MTSTYIPTKQLSCAWRWWRMKSAPSVNYVLIAHITKPTGTVLEASELRDTGKAQNNGTKG